MPEGIASPKRHRIGSLADWFFEDFVCNVNHGSERRQARSSEAPAPDV